MKRSSWWRRGMTACKGCGLEITHRESVAGGGLCLVCARDRAEASGRSVLTVSGGLRLAAVLALACCLTAHAQVAAPKPAPMVKVDWALLVADATSRALDAASTRAMLTAPCHCNYERVLPPAIADHAAALYAWEGAVVAAEYLAARSLRRHGHPRLARLVPLADALGMLPSVVHNYRLAGQAAAPPAPVAVPFPVPVTEAGQGVR